MDKIEILYNEWLKLQPLKPIDKKRLSDKFSLEFNYNSNHIEGNTLSYGQTKLLLMFGETTGSAKIQDYEEMKAHNVGLEMTRQEANDNERTLTETFIRQLNRTILVRSFWKNAITPSGEQTRMKVKVGEYKSRPNHVLTSTGETFYYASPEETPVMMKELVDWYKEEEGKGRLSPIELASILHYRYIRIHPFEDGNGRIARLLVNYVLIRNNYPMLIIKSIDKDNYLRILHLCDINVGLTPSEGAMASLEQINPFVDYMKEQLVWSLEISIKAAREGIDEEDDFAKELSLLQRKMQQKEEEKKNKILFSTEQVWNILEFFYFPFTERISKELKPAAKMFSQVSSSNRISKNGQKKGALHLNYVKRENAREQEIDFVSNAKAMLFHYELLYFNFVEPKHIEIDFKVIFENDYYVVDGFDNKKFNYGDYPNGEDIEMVVSNYKSDVLNKIKLFSGEKS